MIRRFFVLVFILSLAWTGCGSDDNNTNQPTGNSAVPAITGFSPAEVHRVDEDQTGTITGTNLAGVTAVSLGTDIVVLSFSSTSATEVGVTFRVPVNAAPGARTVTVTTPAGTASSSSVLTVSSDRAPIAQFTMQPASGSIDTVFRFDASTSNDNSQITGYAWDFGDASTGKGKTVTHKYATAGEYSVTLTVTDDSGLQSQKQKVVSVEAFNDQAAIAEINQLITRFFKRYSQLNRLSPEVIVEGWSTSKDCTAREKEIAIIERQQKTITFTTATITKSEVKIRPDHLTGDAEVRASFEWISRNDGKTHRGAAIHNFTMIFDQGSWQVCQFSVEPTSEELPQ